MLLTERTKRGPVITVAITVTGMRAENLSRLWRWRRIL
jgi:hypothetical protein